MAIQLDAHQQHCVIGASATSGLCRHASESLSTPLQDCTYTLVLIERDEQWDGCDTGNWTQSLGYRYRLISFIQLHPHDLKLITLRFHKTSKGPSASYYAHTRPRCGMCFVLLCWHSY